MKRKFFSVLAAACVALSSLSGLTGCSGGENNDATYGIVTLDDFAKGRKGVRVSLQGAGLMEIMPDPSASSDIEVGDPDKNKKEDEFRVGTEVRDCLVNGKYRATVTYRIAGWTANNEYPTDGVAGDVNTTTMTIIFNTDDAAAATKDANLLYALGAYPSKENLVSSIELGLQYANGTCDGLYTLGYLSGNTVVNTIKTNPGIFFVVKK